MNVASGEASGSGVRAAEALASHDRLVGLMDVQRERFTDARPLEIPDPEPVDPSAAWVEEWGRRKGEVRFWQRTRRKELRLEVDAYAQASAAERFAEAQTEHREQQARADAWWSSLNQGESIVLKSALESAFADNPAPVAVVEAGGSNAVLVVLLPGLDVLPQKKAHVTPTGRLSSKAWTKTELNEVYTELLAAHLVATVRETWAVAPSLKTLRILGVCKGGVESGLGILFDVDADRSQGHWAIDSWGETMLEQSDWGLNRTGRTNEVRPWPKDQLRPDAYGLLRVR